MHQELIDELLQFSLEYNLRFDYNVDKDSKMYRFTFYNQERTWGYCREYSMEQLDLFNGSTVYFAHEIINTLKRTMAFNFIKGE